MRPPLLDQGLDLIEGDLSLRLAAIDEEGRRTDHAKLPPPLLNLGQAIDNGLIR